MSNIELVIFLCMIFTICVVFEELNTRLKRAKSDFSKHHDESTFRREMDKINDDTFNFTIFALIALIIFLVIILI